MLDTIKRHYQTIDNARQSARTAAHQEAEAQRFIDALVPALNEQERAAYDEFMAKRETSATT